MNRAFPFKLTTVTALLASTVIAADLPTIDGNLTDPFWSEHARRWSIRHDQLPDNAAVFYFGLSEESLYVAADVTDRNVLGHYRLTGEPVWRDDSVELYIDFGDGDDYSRTPRSYSYHFGAGGGASWTRGVTDGFGVDYPGHDWPTKWKTAARWSVQAKKQTTLNFPADRDSGFMVEARIPWKELGRTGPPAPNEPFGVAFVNLCRPEQDALEKPTPITSAPGITEANAHMPRLWQRIQADWEGPLKVRGIIEPLPLWVGTSYEHDKWKAFQTAEHDPAGPWFDRTRWQAKFRAMRNLDLNVLVLEHPHPFPAFLALSSFPDATWFEPWQRQQHVRHFEWILSEASRASIDVYLATRNIILPRAWAVEQSLVEIGADTPKARQYTRQAVLEMMRAFPDLDGLITTAGDQPPHCLDFVIDTTVGGLNLRDRAAVPTARPQRATLAAFGLSTQYCSPRDVLDVFEARQESWFLHELQHRQWFKPAVDPGLNAYQRVEFDAPVRTQRWDHVLVGGPQGASTYLLWADPAWMRQLMADARCLGFRGFLLRNDSADRWITREAFARYAQDLQDAKDDAYWTARLDDVYDVSEEALDLLEAIRHASAIMPRVSSLFHGKSAMHMPQFGLLMAQVVGLPTLSTLQPTKTEAATEAKQTWDERIAPIGAGFDPSYRGGTQPREIAEVVRTHAASCRRHLSLLHRAPPATPEDVQAIDVLLARIELNAALGEHFYHRILAGIQWNRFKNRGGRLFDFTKELAASVDKWKEVVAIANRLYPDRVRLYRMQPVSPPPWTAAQINESYQFMEGHWRDMLPIFERELALIQSRVDADHRKAELPLWDALTAGADTAFQAEYQIDFEIEDETEIIRGEGASITSDPQYVLEKTQSLLVDTSRLDDGWHTVLTTDPDVAPLRSDQSYEIRFRYRVIEPGSHQPLSFEAGFRPADGGQAVGHRRVWTAPAGYVGTRVIPVPPQSTGDYIFFIDVHGQASIVIDQIDILRSTEF